MGLFKRFYFWLHRIRFSEDSGEPEPATAQLVSERFKKLFLLHGIQESEIPEIYPEITLYDLSSNDKLLQKLTPEFLLKTAQFFKVNIEWLRSGESRLYDSAHWYKNLNQFFVDLKTIDLEKVNSPFEIITTQSKFDASSQQDQPFTLILKKPVAEIDGRNIYQYYVETEWQWIHPSCRLQAKALATRYYQITHRPITIRTVDAQTFAQLTNFTTTPALLRNRNLDVSFEEYGALKLPHMEPYEKEEWEAILKTSAYYKLDQVQASDFRSIDTSENVKESKVTAKKPGRKKNLTKLAIKDRFVTEYKSRIDSKELSIAAAAREYFDGLEPSDEIQLFRSEKDYKSKTPDELRNNAERTLKEHYTKYGKSST